MRIVTKKRANKAADEIIDAVLDNTDFDVEVCGYQDYEVHLFINKNDKPVLTKLLYDILTNKRPRKWWQLISISVRRTK